MIDLIKVFIEETGESIYETEYKDAPAYNERYVEWLEDMLLKALTKDLTFTE